MDQRLDVLLLEFCPEDRESWFVRAAAVPHPDASVAYFAQGVRCVADVVTVQWVFDEYDDLVVQVVLSDPQREDDERWPLDATPT